MGVLRVGYQLMKTEYQYHSSIIINQRSFCCPIRLDKLSEFLEYRDVHFQVASYTSLKLVKIKVQLHHTFLEHGKDLPNS